jgi:hypothetical protein
MPSIVLRTRDRTQAMPLVKNSNTLSLLTPMVTGVLVQLACRFSTAFLVAGM